MKNLYYLGLVGLSCLSISTVQAAEETKAAKRFRGLKDVLVWSLADYIRPFTRGDIELEKTLVNEVQRYAASIRKTMGEISLREMLQSDELKAALEKKLTSADELVTGIEQLPQDDPIRQMLDTVEEEKKEKSDTVPISKTMKGALGALNYTLQEIHAREKSPIYRETDSIISKIKDAVAAINNELELGIDLTLREILTNYNDLLREHTGNSGEDLRALLDKLSPETRQKINQ